MKIVSLFSYLHTWLYLCKSGLFSWPLSSFICYNSSNQTELLVLTPCRSLFSRLMFSPYLKSMNSSGNLAIKYKNKTKRNLCNMCNSQQTKPRPSILTFTQKWGWKSGTKNSEWWRSGNMYSTYVSANCAWWAFGFHITQNANNEQKSAHDCP